MFYAAIVLTVVSNVLYHIFLKVAPSQVNPMLALTVVYLTAAVISLGLLPFFPLQEALAVEIRRVNWTSLAIGAAIVGLELGFLLAYRLGWNISLASLISNASVAVVLLPLGLLLFRERLTPVHGAGILVCVVGLVLINWPARVG